MTDTAFAEAAVHCAGCGGSLFESPTDPQSDDVVTCKGCRTKWRYADLQAAAKDKALEAVKKMFGDMLKDSGLE